ncbi:MAG: hypothetical protein NTY04_03730, partial [Candidatus Staskawiczbacteria bacterium]|nr:hypothetical protein [Candidatus Staskawiczbacteria bacterium]
WVEELATKVGFSVPWLVKLSGKKGRRLASNLGWIALEALNAARKRSHSCVWLGKQGDPFAELKLEPTWVTKLPKDARMYIRKSWAMTDGLDSLAIVPNFPLTGIGYIVCDDTLAVDACRTFKLFRLSRVKQLSFLHDPVLRETDRSAGCLMFDHTRYLHSLDAYVLGNLVFANNQRAIENWCHEAGINWAQLENSFRTAVISHDALTPAGGDSVKLIDPQAFDEETHFSELLVGDEWESFEKRWNVNGGLIASIVRGEGLLGSILDLVDKTSYIARDAAAYYMMPMTKDSFRRRPYSSTGYCAVNDLLSSAGNVCGLWESAKVIAGKLVIGDVGRLEKFLILRALLFRELYYNPASRFFEYLVGKGVIKYLYDRKQITRQELLANGDEWVHNLVDKTFGTRFILSKFWNLKNARIEEHPNMQAACKRANELFGDMGIFAIVDDFQSKTSSATRKFLVRQGGQTVKFMDACPEATQEVENIMQFGNMTRLFIFSMDDLEIRGNDRKRIKELFRSVQPFA